MEFRGLEIEAHGDEEERGRRREKEKKREMGFRRGRLNERKGHVQC